MEFSRFGVPESAAYHPGSKVSGLDRSQTGARQGSGERRIVLLMQTMLPPTFPLCAGVKPAPRRLGLLPSWVDNVRTARKPINAPAETMASSPIIHAAFSYNRCLIPAAAYYE